MRNEGGLGSSGLIRFHFVQSSSNETPIFKGFCEQGANEIEFIVFMGQQYKWNLIAKCQQGTI